jgi:hypothetical protein
MEIADVLYLPLSLDAQFANFARFSLSTKLITYLGSGLPILYHGPEESAANRLLATHRAGMGCHSLDPDEIAKSLEGVLEKRTSLVENALRLAQKEFPLEKIRLRFHSSLGRISPTDPA